MLRTPWLLIALIALLFAVLGGLLAVLIDDLVDDTPPRPAGAAAYTPDQRVGTRPITSTDCPNGGAIRDSTRRVSGTTSVS